MPKNFINAVLKVRIAKIKRNLTTSILAGGIISISSTLKVAMF